MATVEAGKLLDTIKGLIGLLDKSIDKLAQVGLKVKEKEEDEDGVIYTFTGKDDEVTFKVKVTPVDESGDIVNLICKDEKNHKEKKYDKVKANRIDDAISKFCEEAYGSDYHSQVDSSSKFQVSLKRVCGSKYDRIQMTSIKCASAMKASAIKANLDVILDNDDIIEQITEEPITFEVLDEGDDLDVSPVDAPIEDAECDCNQYVTILAAAYDVLNLVTAIHWNAKGDKFDELHRVAEGFIYTMRSHIDTLGELAVERCGAVPSPISIMRELSDDCNTLSGFDFDGGIQIIQGAIANYISALETFYCNQTHDVQSVLDNWIRDLNSQRDYFLQRRLM